MTLSMDSGQTALAARRSLCPVWFLTLTTYTNAEAATVDTVYRFGDRLTTYDYGNTGTDQVYLPHLASIGPLVRTMPNMPDGEASGAGDAAPLRASCSVVLANTAYLGGSRLWSVLRAKQILGAKVELASVLVDIARGQTPADLRSLTGTEHRTWLTGRVARVEGISDEGIQLRIETVQPTIPWRVAADAAKVDPIDVGARLPVPFGHAKRIACLNLTVGHTTTLSQALGKDTTGEVKVSDATGFPDGAFRWRIDGEEMACTKAAGVVSITARAQEGTKAAGHDLGAVVLEVNAEGIVVCAAGKAVRSLGPLYLVNPYSGSLFAVPAELYTAEPRDTASPFTTAAPGATYRITQANARLLSDAAHTSALVEQQASYGTPSTSGTVTPLEGTEVAVFATKLQSSGNWTNQDVAGSVFTRGGSDRKVLKKEWTGSLDNVNVVKRFYFRIKGTIAGLTGEVDIRVKAFNFPGIPNGTTVIDYQDITTSSFDRATGWYDGDGKTLHQLLRTSSAYLELWYYVDSSTPVVTLAADTQWGVFYEHEPSGDSIATPAEIVAASQGFGWRFYSDVDGVEAPETYAAGYAFDEGTGWSVTGCAQASETSDKQEGSAAQKFTRDATTLISRMEAADSSAAAAWNPTNCSHADEATEVLEGSGSIKITASGSSATVTEKDRTAFSLASKFYGVAVLIPANRLSATDGFRLRLSSTAGGGSNYKEWTFGTDDGIVGGAWSLVAFDPNTRTPTATNGTLNLASVVNERFVFNRVSGALNSIYYLDGSRSMPNAWRAQRNSVGAATNLNTQHAEIPIWTMDAAGFSDAAAWTVSGGTPADDTGSKTQGTASIKLTSSGTGAVTMRKDVLFGLTQDLSHAVILADVLVPSGKLSNSDGVRVALGNVSDFSTDWAEWRFGLYDGLREGEWSTLWLDPTNAPPNSTGGDLDLEAVSAWRFGFNHVSGAGSIDYRVDNVRVVYLDNFKRRYQVKIKAVGVAAIERVRVYVSNIAGSGATQPASYAYFDVAREYLSEGAWVTVDGLALDFASGVYLSDLQDVLTIGVEITGRAADPGSVYVIIDDLRVRAPASSPYQCGGGNVVERGVDVVRWVVEQFATPAQTFDPASSASNLTGDAHAGDFRDLGWTFEAILARLALETRSNIVAAESSSGAVVRMLNADATGAFPAAASALREWESISEAGRDLAELGTDFVAHFDQDRSLDGVDESTFRGVVRASPDVNDTTLDAADFTAAVARLGRIYAEPWGFRSIADAATAKDRLRYFAQDGMRDRARLVIGRVPWFEGYALELGDIRNVTLPWESVALKGRVIEVAKDPATELVDLRLMEVA